MAGDTIHRGVIEVAVDGSGVTAGIEQAKASLKGLGDTARDVGTKLGAGIGTGAGGAGKATEQLDAATRRFLTTLERESMQAGRTRSEYLALRAAKLGVADSTSGMIARIRDAERGVERMGLTAKQTTAALRQVPAQFTDIIVSLQGGQSPMQVLLQQGGQLKDVFGGAGPAVRAIGNYVAGLINPFTLAAGAVAALGYAYFLGSKEADAYARATILTGNVTGTTVGQLSDMARAIGQVTGSQSAAAEALAQFASSGQVAGSRLEEFTTIALKMEKLTGAAVSETVKKFVELGKEPVEASRKLNEAENYLTLAIYEQIKALQEQGKATEAAALAQTTYADASNARLGELQDRLGYIERGWNAVAKATIEAANAALNVGRVPSNTDRIQQLREGAANARAPLNFGLFDARAKAMDMEADSLERTEAASRRAALADRDRAVIAKEGISAVEKATRTTQQYATEQEKVNRALAEYRRENEKIRAANPDSKLLDPALVARTEKGIREQFNKKGGSRSSPVELDTGRSELEAQLADSKRILDSLTGAYRNAESILEAVRSAGLVSEGEYYDAKRKFIADNALAVANAAIDQEAALELEAERLQAKAAKLKGNDAVRVEREIIDINRKIADSEFKRAQATENAATQTEILNTRQAASLASLTRSYEEARIAAEQYLNSLTLQQDREVSALGTGRRGRDQAAGRNQITDRYQGQREQLEAGKRLLEFEKKFDEQARAQYETRLAIIEEFNAKALASFDAYYARRLEKEYAFNTGASDALNDYLDSVKNVAAETERLFGKAFSGLEDALLDFTKTGKLNFKSLAQSITDDLNRTIIRQNITGPLAEWLQGGLKTGEGAAGSITDGLRVLMGGKQSQGGPDVAQQGFLSLKTLGIDPATEALMRFTQAANSAQFGGRPSTSANQDAFSLDGVFTSDGSAKSLFDVPADGAKEFSSTLVSAKTGTEQFLDILKPASQALAGMGQAGSAAAFALQLLPGIIQSMQGSGGGGGFIGSLFSMFTGSANAAGGANAAGFGSGAGFGNLDLGGFLASGGPAEYGKAYMVGEQGRELFIPRTSGTVVPNGQTEKLMRGGNGGTVNQHFYVTGAVDKRTQGQVFSEAARGATMARARGTA